MRENKYTALIADDEALARDYLRSLLEEYKFISVVFECANGLDATRMILDERPDFVFLDIQMPDLDGFGVIREVSREGLIPCFIFITAYDHYAVKAFEVNAIDYLLKPFDKKRFDESLDRLIQCVSFENRQGMNKAVEGALRTYLELKQQALSDRLLIKVNRKIIQLNKKDILWLEASGDYVKIHLQDHYHLVNTSLNQLEEKLGLSNFVRIHRSSVVNLDYVKEFWPYYNGEYVLILQNGHEVKLSRSYKDKLKGLLDAID